MSPRQRRSALERYVREAYPRRYPKMVVMEGTAFVAFELDEVLDGSAPFATWLDLSSADYALQIERARNRAEAAAHLSSMSRRDLLRLQALIRHQAADGLDERTIAARVGANVYIVERLLREQTAAEVIRLDRVERLSPKAIGTKLRIPIARVHRALSDAAEPGSAA